MDGKWQKTGWAPRAGLFPPRSLHRIMTVVALSGLAMAALLPRGGPTSVPLAPRVRPRIALAPRLRLPRPPVPAPVPGVDDRMIFAAPADLDPRFLVSAPVDLDPRMVVPPSALKRR